MRHSLLPPPPAAPSASLPATGPPPPPLHLYMQHSLLSACQRTYRGRCGCLSIASQPAVPLLSARCSYWLARLGRDFQRQLAAAGVLAEDTTVGAPAQALPCPAAGAAVFVAPPPPRLAMPSLPGLALPKPQP